MKCSMNFNEEKDKEEKEDVDGEEVASGGGRNKDWLTFLTQCEAYTR